MQKKLKAKTLGKSFLPHSKKRQINITIHTAHRATGEQIRAIKLLLSNSKAIVRTLIK